MLDEITKHVTKKIRTDAESEPDVICEAVLNEMLASSPEIVEAWRRYDRRYKF